MEFLHSYFCFLYRKKKTLKKQKKNTIEFNSGLFLPVSVFQVRKDRCHLQFMIGPYRKILFLGPWKRLTIVGQFWRTRWYFSLRTYYPVNNIQGRRSRGGCRGCSPHFFPNVMLKQLCFKTLVVQFPREAYKMLYFYLKPPPPLVIPLRRPWHQHKYK